MFALIVLPIAYSLVTHKTLLLSIDQISKWFSMFSHLIDV